MAIMTVGIIATLLMMLANTLDARIANVLLPMMIARSLEFLGYALVFGFALSRYRPRRIAESNLVAQIACLISHGTNYVLAYAPFLPEEHTTAMPFMVLILFLYYTVVPGIIPTTTQTMNKEVPTVSHSKPCGHLSTF